LEYWVGLSVFCRHNRFTADCPICSKGTVLDRNRKPARRPGGSRPARDKAAAPAGAAFSGRYVGAGPYEDDEGKSYEVRLERVPGGIRLAEWGATGLRRRAPVLAAGDVPALVEGAAGVLEARDADGLAGALEGAPPGARAEEPAPGVSRGRSGDFKEELRVEPLGEGRVRIARWVLRPGSGWQLQEAPPMLPAARYAEALADAVRRGLLSSASDAGDAARL
jgi:hypothetical protein